MRPLGEAVDEVFLALEELRDWVSAIGHLRSGEKNHYPLPLSESRAREFVAALSLPHDGESLRAWEAALRGDARASVIALAAGYFGARARLVDLLREQHTEAGVFLSLGAAEVVRVALSKGRDNASIDSAWRASLIEILAYVEAQIRHADECVTGATTASEKAARS